ncbi:hypothetical protein D3C79_517810 [compost metagenome]
MHTPASGVAQFSQQAIAGEEVSVGHHQALARRTKGQQILLFDGIALTLVVTFNQYGADLAGRLAHRPDLTRWFQHWCQQAAARSMQLGNHRPGNLHRIVLLGHWPIITQVVSAIIDATNEGLLAIDHHDLAVQAPEKVGPHTDQPRLRIEHVKADADFSHGADEGLRQVSGAITIDHDLDPYTALRRFDQHLLQFLAHLVIKEDKGLQQHFFLGVCNRGENAGVVVLTIDQQLHTVAVYPGSVHRLTSAASGA